MPRPRRDIPTDADFTGNNDRILFPAQAILTDGLRAWFASLGTADTVAAKMGYSNPSMIAKMLACQARIPKTAAADWQQGLKLTADEQRVVGIAAALCHANVTALAFVNPNWKAAVKRLKDELLELAERRRRAVRRRSK